MTGQAWRRAAATALASAFMFVFVTSGVGGWLQANVQEWAKANKQDQYLVEYWEPLVNGVALIAHSGLFVFLCGLFVGGALYAWIEYFFRRKGQPHLQSAQSVVSARTSFTDEVVHLTDLVRQASPLISGRTFTRCIIVGPAFLKAVTHNRFEFVAADVLPDKVWVVLPESAGLLGAIALSHVTFSDCLFTNISMVGTYQDRAALQPAFHQETRDAWERRIAFTGKGAAS